MQQRQINQSIPLSLALMLMISSFGSIIFAAQRVSAQVVIAVTGRVEWKPQGGTRFNPVSRNMTLTQGSSLQLEQGASVTISCPNGRSRDVTTQGVSDLLNICQPRTENPVSGRIFSPRNGAQDIPYAILPRATEIITPRPTLRWNAATGANRFTLIVRGRGLTWTEQVERAEVCQGQTCEFVPGELALRPGIDYRFVIEADNGRSSSEESTPGLGFKLLEATLATEVHEIGDRINTQNLPDISQALAIANLYTSYNLIAEAIQTLETIPTIERTAEVHRQLGDLYRQIGLSQEAEVQYLAAIQQAEATNNPFERAAAQAGLGEVNYALGRREAAVQLLQSAKEGYESLGDVEQVTRLEGQLMQVR